MSNTSSSITVILSFVTILSILTEPISTVVVGSNLYALPISKSPPLYKNNFEVNGTSLIDLNTGQTIFLKGIGYSPFLPGETPMWGANLPNDNRYLNHLKMIKNLNANFILAFPQFMPPNFFTAIDKTGLLYAQDIYVNGWADDLLEETFQNQTIEHIKKVIDYTYSVGRPNRLVFFSVGDEINAGTIFRTDTRHPGVTNFDGNYIHLANQTPSEVAIARLMDAAITYEVGRYGVKHLYTHTSWTHIGPVANRPDLEVSQNSVFSADFGDIICMNVYTYARGVVTSPQGSVTGTTYQGYIEDLISISRKPVIITQVGLSTSPIAPNPDIPDFGGNSPEKVIRVYKQVWEDVRTARGSSVINGLSWFEFSDEWWKIGNPSDEFSHENNDPEEWFGMYSVSEDGRLNSKGSILGTIHEAIENLFSQTPQNAISRDDLIVDFGNFDAGINVYYNNGDPWTGRHHWGPGPYTIVMGDLDGNGQKDLIVDFGYPWGINVLYNDGPFSTWTQIHNFNPGPGRMVVGDLDGNGKDDLIVDFGNFNAGINVYYNNSPPWTSIHPWGPGQGRMTIGDLDGSGKKDLIVDFGNFNAGINVYYNNSGPWTSIHPWGPGQGRMVVGDMDGNGKDDLIVDFGSYYAGINVYYNNSAPWTGIHPWGPGQGRMVVGDMDGNGKDDLIVDFGDFNAGINVYYNNAAPWTGRHHWGPGAGRMVMGDLDGNGKDDLIVDFGSPWGINVLYNNGPFTSWTGLHNFSPGEGRMVTGNMDGR